MADNESIIFYMDDDVNGKAIRNARKSGVQLVTSREAGNGGVVDEIHFEYAIQHEYVLVTANIQDFLPLFNQWLTDGKDHPGLIVITAQHIQHAALIAQTLREIQRAGAKTDMANQIWWI